MPWLATHTRLFCLLAPCLIAGAALAASDARTQIKESEQRLEEVRSRIQAVTRKLAEDRSEQDQLQNELRATEQRVAELAGELRRLRKETQTREREAGIREKERAKASQRLEAQRGALKAELRTSFMVGRQQKAKMLLNQEDPNRVGRLLAYFEYMSEARAEHITGIQKEVTALQEAEAALAKELTALGEVKDARAAALTELESARAERSRRLDAVDRRIASAGSTLRDLKRSEDQLERLLQSLKRELEDVPAEFGSVVRFGAARGKLPWPVKGPLIANFGQTKSGTNLRWNGIWIRASSGVPVRAVANGRVVYVGWMHRLGLIVILQHEDGYYTLYAHNQESRVQAGDTVKAGKSIATVGDSGGHRQSGLYFEIRRAQTPINPTTWLRRG